jgi:1-deoxy-D-xylulose-5-phosphate synthase
VGLEGLDLDSLRAMDEPELAALSADIRQFLVESVGATGGHLGSNLGVVELTLAIHRVFDSPRQAVVWDTGHQAYVHKLVTGRARDFPGLRQAGGLSGYPNRTESAHDLVENSHASTSLSYAYGLARARQLHGDHHPVVAVIGDGALTGGLAYEALNNIGTYRTPVVVILNDNGRSYAPTVTRLSDAGPRSLSRPPAAAFFESLGLTYRGPVDGHDIGKLEQELQSLAAGPLPAVLHVHTDKGRGYGPAEADDDKRLHDIGPFDPATGTPTQPGVCSYTQAFTAALLDEAELHPELVALTAAMPGPTGLSAFRDRYPDRFFDVGIAEQHAVTTAAGMAMGGLRPVVAIYSTFLNRAWDQIYHDVGLHRLPVIFCIDRAGITGEDGPSHHGLLDLALLSKVPGMTVLAPSCYEEVPAMLRQALAITSGPVAIRWPKGEARRAAAGIGAGMGAVGTGLAAVGTGLAATGTGLGATGTGLGAARLRSGTDVCLLGVGKLVAACQEAAELLAEAGVDATVWDVRVASPLDPAMIDDAGRHRLVLTAEDGVIEGGVGSLVSGALTRSAGMARQAGRAGSPRAVSCGVPLAYLPHGRADDILASLGLDGAGLCATVLHTLEWEECPPA